MGEANLIEVGNGYDGLGQLMCVCVRERERQRQPSGKVFFFFTVGHTHWPEMAFQRWLIINIKRPLVSPNTSQTLTEMNQKKKKQVIKTK